MRPQHRLRAEPPKLAIGYTGRDKMRRFEHTTRHGFRTFAPDDLEPALGAAGFQDVRSEALGGVLAGQIRDLGQNYRVLTITCLAARDAKPAPRARARARARPGGKAV